MTTVNSINNKNKVIPFHPAANIFPLLEGAEFAALVEDIKNNGLRYSIKLLGNKILDGRNRYRAAQAAGYTFTAFDFEDLPAVDPVSYVISANIRRRHLTPEDQTKYLAELVAKQPEKSDRQFAKETGVSHPTIAKARKRAEATGKALPVAKRVGGDGKARKQPSRKRRPPTEDDFKREIAAKKAAAAPKLAEPVARDPIAPDEVTLLREFALFVIGRARVTTDPKDHAEFKALLGKVKAMLGITP